MAWFWSPRIAMANIIPTALGAAHMKARVVAASLTNRFTHWIFLITSQEALGLSLVLMLSLEIQMTTLLMTRRQSFSTLKMVQLQLDFVPIATQVLKYLLSNFA